MSEFKVHNLWPIPVYENKIEIKPEWVNYSSINFERMHTENGDISKNKYILDELPDLKIQVEKHCELFLKKYLFVKDNCNFYLQNSWIVKHKPGDYAQIHYHGNSLLSGVLYLKTPKNSGSLVFHKNHLNTNLFNTNIMIEHFDDNNIICGKYFIECNKGTIVLFPSHLEHSVEKNNSNEDRYSLAFNFFVKGKLGDLTGPTDLELK